MDLDSDEEIDPTTMIFPAADGASSIQPFFDKDHHHYINSMNLTITVRQLPSQGLSFQLWPATTTLVSLLDTHRLNPNANRRLSTFLSPPADQRRPLRILELGSGTGLAGIVAAATLGADVTLTDLPHVIPNLQFNVEANAGIIRTGRVVAAPLRWGDAEDMLKVGREYDIVLGSDLVYHDHLYEPLLESLKYLLGGEKRCVFVMAHLRRWKKEAAFFKKARKLFRVEIVFQEAPADGSRVGVVVYGFLGKQHFESSPKC